MSAYKFPLKQKLEGEKKDSLPSYWSAQIELMTHHTFLYLLCLDIKWDKSIGLERFLLNRYI